MNTATKHILLCGNRRSGRSSMIRALLRNVQVPVSGFMTKTMNTRNDGYHEIYMFPYGSTDLQMTETSHIGDCNTRERIIHNDVFNSLGVELLTQKPQSILVMDEVGFMESQAKDFCNTILSRLSGNSPVLAAVRTSIDTPFIHSVLASDNALVVNMQPECFEQIYLELSPVVSAWVEEFMSC